MRRLYAIPFGATRGLAVTALVVSALALSAASAQAAGNAIENLPGCTTNTFLANDDGSTALVPLGFTANFYGTSYTSLYVNNNGNVTFDGSLGTYTPFDFTTSGNVIIAPYLADVDTRGTGNGSSPVTYGSGTLADGTNYFCVNWVNVGYYAQHTDKLNSFQLLLTQSPSEASTNNNFTITFNYDSILWETGDASGGTGGFGGTPAAVGYSAGDGVNGHSYVQPGSFTTMSLEDSNTSTGLINNTLNAGGQLGRYVFPIVNGPVSGGTVTGTVFANDGSTPLEFAPVDICPTGGGACFSRSTNSAGVYRAGGVPAGTYNVTADPPSGDSEAPATVGPITVTVSQTTTANVTLGPNPNAPPGGTTLTGPYTNPGGIPVINWEQTGTLTTIACGGASLNWAMLFNGNQIAGGQMTQTTTTGTDGSATYQATYPAVAPNHGNAHIKITGTCPVGGTPVDTEFDIYIDPSGKVVDTNGNPISGATVTLFRSDSASGPFIQIPEGSAEMSPANRNNPDTTLSDGSFGWDVTSGYYEVQATAPGCSSPSNHSNLVSTSQVMTIPPPVTNLVITMFCGGSSGGGGGSGGGGSSGGGNSGSGNPGVGTSGPTAQGVIASVNASLASQLHSLLAALKSHLGVVPVTSFKVSFGAVQRGTLSMTITTVLPATASAAAKGKKHRPKTITVAIGQLTVTGPGTDKVTIKLTGAGKSALQKAAKQHKKLKLKLAEKFVSVLNGQSLNPVLEAGSFSVTPHKKTKRQ